MACSSQAKIESTCKDKVKGIQKSSLKGIFIVSDGPAIQAKILCEWATSRVCMFPLCLCGFALGTLFPPTLQKCTIRSVSYETGPSVHEIRKCYCKIHYGYGSM